jgi:hypothetical protein
MKEMVEQPMSPIPVNPQFLPSPYKVMVGSAGYVFGFLHETNATTKTKN